MAKNKNKSKKGAASRKLGQPHLYINRELSWLEFNDRVLREGLSGELPLLERLKFLAIVSSNLDEFFMIRVAGLKQQRSAGLRRRDISGLTPVQQLEKISERIKRMAAEQSAGIRRASAELAEHGVHFLAIEQLTAAQRRFLDSYFRLEVRPVLTPLAVDRLEPCPVLPGLQLMLAVRLAPNDSAGSAERIAVVPVCTWL